MKKFLVLYRATVPASELLANATPLQMQTSMKEWMDWRVEASKTARVEFGLPLEAVKIITPDGPGNSTSSISGYAIVEGESVESVLALLATHPHLARAGASLEVLQMLSMPGLSE